ncbi:MAG: GTP-binding protein, partial [Pseudomonadota bacterium]
NMDSDKVLEVINGIDSAIKNTDLLKPDIVSLVVEECGHIPNYILSKNNIDYYLPSGDLEQEKKIPVIAFFGHIDHGKTTLIGKCIKDSKFMTKEFGGISQNIKGYNIGDFSIIDTPGHGLLKGMRKEVMSMIDIPVLIIAGNEGIKQQTEECIDYILSCGKKFIIIINKIDLCSEEDIQKVKDDLLDREINILDDIPVMEVSGLKNKNFVKDLSKVIDVFRDDIKVSKVDKAIGYILDSQIDIRQGVVTDVIITAGQLNNKDVFATETTRGRIKGIKDYANTKLKVAKAGQIVTILGAKDVANIGEKFVVVDDEKIAANISASKSNSLVNNNLQGKDTLEDLFATELSNKIEYKILIKAFNYAILEALEAGILDISSEKYNIVIVGKSIGAVTESDLNTIDRGGIIYCLQQKSPGKQIEALAKRNDIVIKNFNIIFDLLNDIRDSVIEKDDSNNIASQVNAIGVAKVLKTFALSNKKVVAGCRVVSGKIHRKYRAVVLREGKELFSGSIISIKVEKEDFHEVGNGKECGIILKGFNDFQDDDSIEVYDK